MKYTFVKKNYMKSVQYRSTYLPTDNYDKIVAMPFKKILQNFYSKVLSGLGKHSLNLSWINRTPKRK